MSLPQDVPAEPVTAERERLASLVAGVLDEARRQGATAAEAGVSLDRGLSVSVRLGEVETVEFTRAGGLGVTVFDGRRKGSASTSDLRPEAIRETVRAALDIARHTSEDPYAGLAEPAQLAKDVPDLDLYHPWALAPDAAIAIAREAEDAGRALDPRIANSEGATLNTHEMLRVYGNSNGFLGVVPGTRHSLSCVLIAREGEDMQRDYWYDSARDARSLVAPADIGRRAADRAVRRLNPQQVATGAMPVLFAPEMAASLVSSLVGAISGGALYRRSSFLLDRLGTAVLPAWANVDERPLLRGGLNSAAFDGDGLPTRAQHFVRDGVLQTYALGLYAARKLGLAPTGNGSGTHNLYVAGRGESFDELVAACGDGILVTELMGQGVNLVTGDYSRGAAGFRIEGGRVAGPVAGLTIAGNLDEMLRGILAIGGDIDHRGNIHCGSILVGRMMVAAQ